MTKLATTTRSLRSSAVGPSKQTPTTQSNPASAPNRDRLNLHVTTPSKTSINTHQAITNEARDGPPSSHANASNGNVPGGYSYWKSTYGTAPCIKCEAASKYTTATSPGNNAFRAPRCATTRPIANAALVTSQLDRTPDGVTATAVTQRRNLPPIMLPMGRARRVPASPASAPSTILASLTGSVYQSPTGPVLVQVQVPVRTAAGYATAVRVGRTQRPMGRHRKTPRDSQKFYVSGAA